MITAGEAENTDHGWRGRGQGSQPDRWKFREQGLPLKKTEFTAGEEEDRDPGLAHPSTPRSGNALGKNVHIAFITSESAEHALYQSPQVAPYINV